MNARLAMDCARCCGLCCVVPPFDAVQGFGFDKPAHVPCHHLRHDNRCAIHQQLQARGFAACANFDCYGAGTWITQVVFGGTSWRDSPQIAEHMFRLYPRFRALHELLWLLESAAQRALGPGVGALDSHARDIEALCDGSADEVQKADIETLRREVRDALRKLGDQGLHSVVRLKPAESNP